MRTHVELEHSYVHNHIIEFAHVVGTMFPCAVPIAIIAPSSQLALGMTDHKMWMRMRTPKPWPITALYMVYNRKSSNYSAKKNSNHDV